MVFKSQVASVEPQNLENARERNCPVDQLLGTKQMSVTALDMIAQHVWKSPSSLAEKNVLDLFINAEVGIVATQLAADSRRRLHDTLGHIAATFGNPDRAASILAQPRERKDWLRACSKMKKLTPREADVLTLHLRAGDLKPVAEAQCVSIHTVRSQRTSIRKKLGANSPVGLTVEAIRRGLVDLNGGNS
jgi:DNA-binding CsgD family transcriptional regulator